MKPAPFQYLQASSWSEAANLLSDHGGDAKVLAGGQTLVPAMNFRLARPSVLIDLNTIANSRYVAVKKNELRIGALSRHVQFETAHCGGPLGWLMPQISRHIAHAPIRMRGTYAGSLAHADPASEWCALSLTMDATIVAEGPTGVRQIGVHEFFVSALTTTLAADEVVREIRIPLLGRDWYCGFREFSRRAGDFALAMAIVCIKISDGTIDDARIGIGGAAVIPFRSSAAEAVLVGHAPGPSAFDRAGEAAAAIADPIEDPQATGPYRCDLVRALVPRALMDAMSLYERKS